MKVALINPPWDYRSSIYFGCRAAHLPLELGYSKALLEAAGHEVLMLDGQIQHLDYAAIARQVRDPSCACHGRCWRLSARVPA
jgi:anaerobic magnesium-protoporphyrin IX monomethyl ester cyclase